MEGPIMNNDITGKVVVITGELSAKYCHAVAMAMDVPDQAQFGPVLLAQVAPVTLKRSWSR
jgi:hypothetical protein